MEKKTQTVRTSWSGRRRHTDRAGRNDGAFSRRTSGSGQRRCNIMDLPDDVLYDIFRFLSPESLCRVSQVCRRFLMLASEDTVWLQYERERTVLRLQNSRSLYGLKERYRVALNWESGHRWETWLLRYGSRMLPWLQREDNTLWMSVGNVIRKFSLQDNGIRLREHTEGRLQGLHSDATRFVIKNGLCVSGCRKGNLSAWETSSGMQLLHYSKIHNSDTQCVDVVDDMIVSGSKDKTAKVVSMLHDDEERIRKCFNIGDRVWSLSVSPNKSTLAVGTACYNYPPIFLWDLNSGQLLNHLGADFKRGSGVLDMAFESPNTLLTCGHDTYLRMWDLRTQTCVNMWEDQFDSAVYCLKTDGLYTMLTGTARHGLAYYSRHQTSPVYSMASDVHRLFLALDVGLNMMDFSIR
ncbi:hypothetical protein BaRGS_00000088 [Batillaria attramentaria]|uniref:F-box domain-containing protein n=1 Tax=Batillaria attramentaria TaxID=370345 RepID=A0ABD0MAC0_9CAEN